MIPRHRGALNAGVGYARVTAFLLGCAVLIIFVARYYLGPAMEAASQATPGQRKVLAAHSWLLMALVLLIVLVGLILTFRVGRFFFPRNRPPIRPTNYPDAWEEAGRRLEISPDDE